MTAIVGMITKTPKSRRAGDTKMLALTVFDRFDLILVMM